MVPNPSNNNMVITESVIRINFFFCFMGFFGNDEFFVFGACTRNLLSENPFPSISQDAEHRAVGLFFGEQAGVVFVVVLVPVDDDVFGGRNQTVLDAAEAADRLLIGSRMEEADILRIPRFELGQEDRVDVRFRVVEIFAVAGQAAQQHTLVFFVPVVDRQHDVALVDAPRIGQSRDEGAVDHVPVLAVVLLFLIDDRDKLKILHIRFIKLNQQFIISEFVNSQNTPSPKFRYTYICLHIMMNEALLQVNINGIKFGCFFTHNCQVLRMQYKKVANITI